MRMTRRPWTSGTVFLAASIAMGCTMEMPPEAPREANEPCSTNAQCASMRCEVTAGRSFCTMACSDATTCPAANGLTTCHPGGFCASPCLTSEVTGVGAERMICEGGAFIPCRDTDPTATCAMCGCAPFGGGNCTSTGCVVPRADGEPCTEDSDCASETCYRDTAVCGSPRPMGGACSVDAECSTLNCSTDGDETATGVCNQALGSACPRNGSSDTCTRCMGARSFSDGICSRRRCDPVDANNCPRTSRRAWVCDLTTDGDHRCFERCDGEDPFAYSCFESGDRCNAINNYCY